MSTMTPPSVEAIDERIDRFREVLDRATRRLVELDADVTRKLLEQSTSLRGQTAERWADASRRHEELWRGHFALDAHLKRVMDLRGTRRSVPESVLSDLEALLEGKTVPMPGGPDTGDISLTKETGKTKRTSIDLAMRQMSDDYEVVALVVAEVADVWGAQMDRLEQLANSLSQIRSSASEAGLREPNELQAVDGDVTRTTELAKDDPLALDEGAISAMESRVRQMGEAIENERRAGLTRVEDLARTSEMIGQAEAALAAARKQVAEWGDKVVVPASTQTTLDGLAARLDVAAQESQRLELLQSAAGVGRLRESVASLLDEVRLVVEAEGQRFSARDELRGVLDAYRAKANALGLAEDADADRLYQRALASLYTAPCDVEEAARQVEAFRHVVPTSGRGQS